MNNFTKKTSVLMILMLFTVSAFAVVPTKKQHAKTMKIKSATEEVIAIIEYYGPYYYDDYGIAESNFNISLIEGDADWNADGLPFGTGSMYYLELMGQIGSNSCVGSYTVDPDATLQAMTVVGGDPEYEGYPSYFYQNGTTHYLIDGTLTVSRSGDDYTITIAMKDDTGNDRNITYTGYAEYVDWTDEGGNVDDPVLDESIIFLETFGNQPVTKTYGPKGNSWPFPDQFSDWSNPSCVFTGTNASIRNVNNINNVWFAADRESFFSIAGIDATGASDLKLSFDIACGNQTANTGNADKMAVTCNEQAVTVPSLVLGEANEFSSISNLPLPVADELTLKFSFTPETNPQNFGYRLANIKITKGTTSLETTEAMAALIRTTGNELQVITVEEGNVEIYNISGALINKVRAGASETVSFTLPENAIYIVKAMGKAVKVKL